MAGNLMLSRTRSASVPMACLTAAAFLCMAPMASTASAGKSVAKPGKDARAFVLKKKRPARSPRIYLPIGPSYIYYDYPYYYSRGYYPTHIGGYIYYIPQPYPHSSHYPGRKTRRMK